MNPDTFLKDIRDRIARDELAQALQLLQQFLANTPHLDEVLQQSGRHAAIRHQIRLGTVSHADASLTQNQISHALLELLHEIEAQEREQPALKQEMEGAIAILNSKNVVSGTTITAAGDVHIGDQTTHIHQYIQVSLPEALRRQLISDRDIAQNDALWVRSLRKDLLNQEVAVDTEEPMEVFQHYGWLVQEFLRKVKTEQGLEATPRRLAFLAETYQSSVRYLVYIQVAQLLRRSAKQAEPSAHHPMLSAFLNIRGEDYLTFDYLSLLQAATGLLPKADSFMPDVHDFVAKLSNEKDDLYGTAQFLEQNRRRLLANDLPDETTFQALLDEYATALVYWLRKIAFLAKYRLASVKDIQLNYRLGTGKRFAHIYGELHGHYAEVSYKERMVTDLFTYNQSVLLFQGSDISTCLRQIHDPNSYLSLTPLLVDKSVLDEGQKQTPELYYYIGQSSESRRSYGFAYYRNELPLPNDRHPRGNRQFEVGFQNHALPRMDEFFEYIESIFEPFQTASQP